MPTGNPVLTCGWGTLDTSLLRVLRVPSLEALRTLGTSVDGDGVAYFPYRATWHREESWESESGAGPTVLSQKEEMDLAGLKLETLPTGYVVCSKVYGAQCFLLAGCTRQARAHIWGTR